jgi:hypothetical protein
VITDIFANAKNIEKNKVYFLVMFNNMGLIGMNELNTRKGLEYLEILDEGKLIIGGIVKKTKNFYYFEDDDLDLSRDLCVSDIIILLGMMKQLKEEGKRVRKQLKRKCKKEIAKMKYKCSEIVPLVYDSEKYPQFNKNMLDRNEERRIGRNPIEITRLSRKQIRF